MLKRQKDADTMDIVLCEITNNARPAFIPLDKPIYAAFTQRRFTQIHFRAAIITWRFLKFIQKRFFWSDARKRSNCHV